MKSLLRIVEKRSIISLAKKQYITILGVSFDARKKWKWCMLLWCS